MNLRIEKAATMHIISLKPVTIKAFDTFAGSDVDNAAIELLTKSGYFRTFLSIFRLKNRNEEMRNGWPD